MGELEYRVAGRQQDSLQGEEGERDELLEVATADKEEVDPEEDPVKFNKKLLEFVTDTDFWTQPWLGWCFTYTVVLLFFSIYRYENLEALIMMYGSVNDYTFGVKAGVLVLGFMEDFVCASYFVYALWVFDLVKQAIKKLFKYQGGRGHADFQKQRRLARLASNFATFLVSWLIFVAMTMPFVCDMLLIRLRELRFTVEILVYAYNERAYIKEAPISTEEFHAAYLHVFIMVIVATFLATVRARARWADLSTWNPMYLAVNFAESRTSRSKSGSTKRSGQTTNRGYMKLEIEDAADQSLTSKSLNANFDNRSDTCIRVSQTAVLLVTLVAFPLFVVGVSSSSSAVVAYSALNVTLDQLFMQALLPMREVITRDPTRLGAWAETYIHYQTEEHELFGDNSLFRRTTGFHGDLAFDVNVDLDNPPNVILISLESARFHNSRYLVGEDDQSNLFNGFNITISPNFDRWAKRGVSFRNMWSSTPSSRSLESVLFAQIPYDNVVKTAIAGGRNGTELSGLPQFFSAKGYETYFTTGSELSYDNWNTFLPTHGFDTVLSKYDMMALAESDLGITPVEWYEPEKRRFPWGVHDDINFQLLGDLLVNKTKEQSERMVRGESKKPMFLMQYTISSHEPFRARPKWFDDMEKPDFSALYEGLDRSEPVRKYLEMEYFVDMELGKFMDRMEQEGVLNNTIVVMFGDHGRAPEFKISDTHDVSVTRVPAAIIAEGRLGDAVGLMIDDAVEHYES